MAMQMRFFDGQGSPRAAAALAALLVSACSVQLTNTQPAQEMARLAQPPGSVYMGWRVFQDKCAGCHGAAAEGTSAAPDLLPRVRDMGSRRFIALVLLRYDLDVPGASAARDGAARDALVDAVEQRREGALAMPAWQGEPRVNAHIVDLYAYVSARAQGTQGPGRPPP